VSLSHTRTLSLSLSLPLTHNLSLWGDGQGSTVLFELVDVVLRIARVPRGEHLREIMPKEVLNIERARAREIVTESVGVEREWCV